VNVFAIAGVAILASVLGACGSSGSSSSSSATTKPRHGFTVGSQLAIRAAQLQPDGSVVLVIEYSCSTGTGIATNTTINTQIQQNAPSADYLKGAAGQTQNGFCNGQTQQISVPNVVNVARANEHFLSKGSAVARATIGNNGGASVGPTDTGFVGINIT
jgi:hypothetical protein